MSGILGTAPVPPRNRRKKRISVMYDNNIDKFKKWYVKTNEGKVR